MVLLFCDLKEKDKLQNEILNKKKTLIYKKKYCNEQRQYSRTRTHAQTLTQSTCNIELSIIRTTDTNSEMSGKRLSC